jgi:hypothetical protein
MKKLLPFLTGVLWGSFEATWFFIVPDILLCYWALRTARQAFWSTVGVTLGALLGAVFIYWVCSSENSASLLSLWNFFPGYAPKMSEVARSFLVDKGALGLTAGPSSGIPYRVFVLEGWRLSIPLQSILFWTPVARLERIIIAPIVILALRGMGSWVKNRFSSRFPVLDNEKKGKWVLTAIIILYWIGLYIWYWGFFVPTRYGQGG